MNLDEYQKKAFSTLNKKLKEDSVSVNAMTIVFAAIVITRKTGILTNYINFSERKKLKHIYDANVIIGLSGEAGEIAEIIKKHVFHGHDLDSDKLKDEVGDYLWYLFVLASLHEINMVDILVDEKERDKSILSKYIVQCYAAIQSFCLAAEISVVDVMYRNIAKLKMRYPHGFSISDSINRGDLNVGDKNETKFQ